MFSEDGRDLQLNALSENLGDITRFFEKLFSVHGSKANLRFAESRRRLGEGGHVASIGIISGHKLSFNDIFKISPS